MNMQNIMRFPISAYSRKTTFPKVDDFESDTFWGMTY